MNVYLTICVSFHFSLADSLSYTSIIYVALIVVFIIIIVEIPMPKLFPTVNDVNVIGV
jgi:hypothetical protein